MMVLTLAALALCLTFASADPSLGACGPTPPTVPVFDPERASGKIENINSLGLQLVNKGCIECFPRVPLAVLLY